MDITNRSNQILVEASQIDSTKYRKLFESIEIDTSCPDVPFGFVLAMHEKIFNQEHDFFWSECLASDALIQLLSATIEMTELKNLDRIFRVIYQDLERVGKLDRVYLPASAEVTDCFTVANGCKYCCGRILLMTTQSEVFYIHWHRES